MSAMEAKKILLVQLGRIGDLILMTPMFKILKEANPENELHLLAGKHNYLLATEHPLIDHVHIYHKRPFDTIRLVQKLRSERFDLWIDVKDHYSTESHWFARLSNAKVKVGFNRNGESIFDYSVRADVEQANKHAVVRNLAAIDFLNLKIEGSIPRPILYVNDHSERKLDNFLLWHNIQNYHCINVSATSDSRYWQPNKWIELLNYLNSINVVSVLIASPSDSELVNKIVAVAKNCYHFPTESIIDVFSVVKHAELTITVDTAVVHIASAFDVPVLALYGNVPANYNKFRPLSTHYRMVMAPQLNSSIRDIGVDLVIQHLADLMAEI